MTDEIVLNDQAGKKCAGSKTAPIDSFFSPCWVMPPYTLHLTKPSGQNILCAVCTVVDILQLYSCYSRLQDLFALFWYWNSSSSEVSQESKAVCGGWVREVWTKQHCHSSFAVLHNVCVILLCMNQLRYQICLVNNSRWIQHYNMIL